MRPMSVIVRSMTKILFPFILVFGAYLVIHGHLTPGGGFQGGAVAASAIALVVVSFGGTKKAYKGYKGVTAGLEATGLLFFISLAFVGISVAFFYNFLSNTPYIFGTSVAFGPNPGYLNTGGVIPLMNIAVGTEVVGGLGAIILALGERALGVRQ